MNDILNLIPLLDSLDKADSSRIGIYGASRGGLTACQALARTDRISAVAILSGIYDFFILTENQPQISSFILRSVPGYETDKEATILARSPTRWVDKFARKAPILLLHGTSDYQMIQDMALEMSKALLADGHPFRLVLYEGGNHGISGHREEVHKLVRWWLDMYIRDQNPPPEMKARPLGPDHRIRQER